jgi:hypothetical protein
MIEDYEKINPEDGTWKLEDDRHSLYLPGPSSLSGCNVSKPDETVGCARGEDVEVEAHPMSCLAETFTTQQINS